MKKAAFFLAVLCVFGCGGASNLFSDDKPIIRVVNVVSGTSVDASVDDINGPVQFLDNQGFATASTNRVTAGTRRVTFTDSTTNNLLVSEDLNVENGRSYTYVAFGVAGAVQGRNLAEIFNPSAGNAAVRVLQAGGTTNVFVDIYTGAAGSDISNATLFRNDLQSGTTVDYQNIPTGTTKFFITDPNNSANVLVSDDIDFVEGKHYTLIVARNNTVQLVTVTED